jgi:hypothetical protein
MAAPSPDARVAAPFEKAYFASMKRLATVVVATTLAASGCANSEKSSLPSGGASVVFSAQALRTCVDRWNQGNMVGWGPVVVNVAFRKPDAKEHSSMDLPTRRQCIVAIGDGGGTYTCVLVNGGAYWCPPLHEPTGRPLSVKNATINGRGVLKLDTALAGTHPTPPLAWHRYPHLDGFILPWTASGKLRPGLRFRGLGKGRCFRVDETARSAISCLTPTGGRFDACFPQRRTWRAGDLAACGTLADTRFVRWTITGR